MRFAYPQSSFHYYDADAGNARIRGYRTDGYATMTIEISLRRDLSKSGCVDTILCMDQEMMTPADIHAFGVEIIYKQLEKDGWQIESVDILADIDSEPQIVASKEGETAFFVVRTGMFPGRGRFEGGQESFDRLVRHAMEHGATCYFASVGIANSQGTTDEEMSVPVKGVAYNVQFDGLVRMAFSETARAEE